MQAVERRRDEAPIHAAAVGRLPPIVAGGPEEPARAGGFQQRLRAETHDAHAAIETVPAFARLLADDLGQAEYAQTLARLHGFHAALDQRLLVALSGVDAAHPFLDGVRVVSIAHDLAVLGVVPPAACMPADALPRLPDAAAALGALYVAEGSSLGGRVIARHLHDVLGLTAGNGARFFSGGDADAVRDRWRRFCGMLQAHAASGGRAAEDAIIGGARATFDRLGHWMNQAAP